MGTFWDDVIADVRTHIVVRGRRPFSLPSPDSYKPGEVLTVERRGFFRTLSVERYVCRAHLSDMQEAFHRWQRAPHQA